MSNLHYFQTNIQEENNLGYPKGNCYTMCPQSEVKMRTKEKLIHILENTKHGRTLVKAYSRSAADSTNMAVPHLLRPFPVLLKTVQYLLLDVIKNTDVPSHTIYDFVNDRLRAVRQDMTIQRLTLEECVTLLEPMIRFYVYYGYKLCEAPLQVYDPVLNNKYLLECIKWFLSACDQIDRTQKSVDTITDLSSELKILDIDNSTKKLTCDRVLVECLYILCNLHDVHPLYRYYNLPDSVKGNKELKLAYNIAVANLKGHYVQVSRMLKSLCPLCYSAFCMYLPTMQRRGLEILSTAYNSKVHKVPVAVLKEWLHFHEDFEVMDICKYYGLTIEERAVKFSKTDFKRDIVTHDAKKNYLKMEVINNIDYIFTYRKS